MSRPALIEYLTGLLQLYKGAPKYQKTLLLTQAQVLTGKSRRTILRYMAKKPEQLSVHIRIQGRGREPLYPAALLLPHIRTLWKCMEFISAERMVAALPTWLSHYTDPSCSDEVREKLLAMSRCTLERLLATLRQENKAKRGLSTTTSGLRAFKTKIPINTLDHHVVRPGFTQADTVAHCGTTTAGQYVNSLTLTDLFSGWTVNRAIATKKAIEVRRAFVDIKTKLPFKLIAVNTDSGSEFINEEIFNLMTANPVFAAKEKIIFTRSRPYKKNDNCYVEQKNYTHVRQLFGYYRIEEMRLVDLMNEIYTDYWNPLHNFFLPSQKLIEKNRVGSKIVKKHDDPKTPAQRLLACKQLSEDQERLLRTQIDTLNPFELSRQLEQKLKTFFDLYKQSITHREAA